MHGRQASGCLASGENCESGLAHTGKDKATRFVNAEPEPAHIEDVDRARPVFASPVIAWL